MPVISFHQRVSIPSGVMVSQLAGESVLLNLKTESYFGLDEVGTSMWEALKTSSDIQAAYERLLGEYDVEPETLQSDLSEFISQLAGHGLLELTAPAV
jgi:hypothetical protein